MTIHINAEENQSEWKRSDRSRPGAGEESDTKSRVRVDNVHEAPDDKTVKYDEDYGLYYEDDGAEEKSWRKYRGPMGGEGWKNVITGEVSYSDQRPGDDERGQPEGLEGAAMETARHLDPVDTAAVAASVTGADEGELLSADRAAGTGLPGGESVLREAVKRAPDPAELLNLFANVAPTADKMWVPYEGPRGGEGWRNLETLEVTYDDEPPGESVESVDDLADRVDTGDLEDEVAQILSEVSDGRRNNTVEVTVAEEADVYAVDGQPTATIVAEPGEKLVVSVEAEGHPLFISTTPGGGGYTDTYESGVSVTGPVQDGWHATEAGVLELVPPANVDKLYYACTNHEGMGGVIDVTDDPATRTTPSVASKAGGFVPDGRMVRVDSPDEAPPWAETKADEESFYYTDPRPGSR